MQPLFAPLALVLALAFPGSSTADAPDRFGEVLARPASRGPAGGPLLPTPAAPKSARGAGPNLSVLAVGIADVDDGSFQPANAGEGFAVRVDYIYENPVCTPYAILRIVDGWEHTAPPITFGCGSSGTTSWYHFWGAWVLHLGGSYELTVALDPDDRIAETDETDNALTVAFDVDGDVTPQWALARVDEARALLGDGTDVVVGTLDDALDFTHPWLDGVDSKGRPRLVASNQNTLGPDGPEGSPLNAEHATAVMGIVLARGDSDGDLEGIAPDARFVTAEFINRSGIPGLPVLHVFDAAGFLVDNGAQVINMSWSWWAGSDDASQRGETSLTNLMADYLAYGLDLVAVPAVNQLPDFERPTAPGSSRNVITVGGLDRTLARAWPEQDHGPTLDGRSKPDLLGSDAEAAVAPSAFWRAGFPASSGFRGTSFSAPFVTGAAALLLDYAQTHGISSDHRVIKAILMTSAVKAQDDDGSPWSAGPGPLDDQQGTGVLDLVRAHDVIAGGRQPAGDVGVPGFDLDWIEGSPGTPEEGTLVYRLGRPAESGADLDATLVWDRPTFWNDGNANGRIDAADSFFTRKDDGQDDLDLVLLRDGAEIAASRSAVDTVEHLHVPHADDGVYELRVVRRDVEGTGDGETFALAWTSSATWIPVPEPGATLLYGAALLALAPQARPAGARPRPCDAVP